MDIKVIYVDSDGLNQEHSEAADSIKMLSFKTANYELTDTRLGNLIGNGDGSAEHHHDSLYFRENEFINVSVGAGDAAKPIITDVSGKIDNSFLHLDTINTSLDHGQLQGLSDDDHLQYIRVDGTRAFTGIQSYNSHPSFTSDFQIVDKKYVDDMFTGREFQDSCLTRTVTPPGSPVTGGRYLVDATLGTPTGAFAGHSNAIAVYTGSGYNFIAPTTGFQLSVDDEADGMYLFGGTSWTKKYYEQTTASNGLTKVGIDIQINPSSAGLGLSFTSGVYDVNVDNSSIEINSDTLRVKALGIKNSMIDFGTGVNQVKAGSIPIADAGNYFPVDFVEDALQFLGKEITENGPELTSAGVNKGDLLFVSANDTAARYATLTNNTHCIGLAHATVAAAGTVTAMANGTILKGVLSGATFNTPYYWNGTTFQTTMPTTSGANVWEVGVAKNATDLVVGVRHIKKNA